MPGTQAGTEYCHPSPILFICRKPYCQQISIITPGNCRLMIMQIKWGIRITCRTYHKWYRRQKHRCDSRYFFPFYRCIFYRFLIERDRGRCSRYIQTSIGFHNSKSSLGMFIFRKHSQSIGTSQVFLRGVMTPSSSDPKLSGQRSCRVFLLFCGIRSIPIQAPFFHISMHIIKPECIRRSLGYF